MYLGETLGQFLPAIILTPTKQETKPKDSIPIPAYNKYQENAKIGVVKSSLQQVSKSINACLAIGTPIASCATNDVNGTLRQQANTVIMGMVGTSAMTTACFTVEYQTGGTTTQKACLQFDATGVPGTFPTDAEIGMAAKGTCNGGTAVCSNS